MVVYDSGASLEQAMAALGHYPDRRNEKGVELESVEVADFGGTKLLFVVSVRASVVAVYDLADLVRPVLRQILPSGISPEGLVAIPARNLLVTANELALCADGGPAAHVMVFEQAEGTPACQMIEAEAGIGGAALSALVAEAEAPGKLYAASDSFLSGAPAIHTTDATQKPARITASLPVTRAGATAQLMDIEGLTLDGEGGFWLANEGRTDRMIPHGLIHVDAEGNIVEEIGLPPELAAVETRYGFEGIAKVGDRLWMAVQRPWGDVPDGMVI